MNNIQWLDWDSDVLGIKVARITTAQSTLAELRSLLIHLKEQGAKLVYWPVDSACLTAQQAAQVLNGFLADRKVTYQCYLKAIPHNRVSQHTIEEYPHITPEPELIELAYRSGLYSRFKTDNRITQQQFEKIYSLWISNSVNKQIADKVLIIKYHHHLAGMITLGEKQGRGDIGLLAVHEQFQGLRIGATLVAAAQDYFAQRYQWSQVVTQEANIPACRLYEHCGYQVEKIENFYHFWL